MRTRINPKITFAPGASLPCQDVTCTVPAASPAAAACRDRDVELDDYRSLLDCLEAVPEPRRRRGIRHLLAVVLAFAVAAVLARADSITAISEWAAGASPAVLAALDARRDRWRDWRVPPTPW